MPKWLNLAAIALVSSLGLLPSAKSRAQEYPTRPVKIIINATVGGVFDTFARALGAELQKEWGRPIIIEPRPGGNFIIAGRACAEAPPDGYTLCALTGESLVQAPLLYKDAKFDPEHSFAPISQLFYMTQLLVANPNVNIKNVADVVDVAKKMPLSFAGLTLSNRLFVSRFNKRHSTDIVFVPQRGGADALNNVIAGNTDIAISSGAVFFPMVQENKIVALAVDGLARSPLYPNVPTFTEAGYQERSARIYLGLVAPKKTPEVLINRVYEAVRKITTDPGFNARSLVQQGSEPVVSSPAEFAAFLTDDMASFAELMKEAGITAQ